MKKFALGILSVFMLMGGMLLASCEKKVSLSVSAEQVEIYTNYQQVENYQKKEVEVYLENSSAGIVVDVVKGQDSVHVSSVQSKGTGRYAFTIFGDKSGQAEIKVSALEDIRQTKNIHVQVNTVLKGISAAKDDNEDGRTSLCVVKGGSLKLDSEQYFDFEPATANICDVVWTFEDGSTEYINAGNGNVVAKIENGYLYVYENFSLSTLKLKAIFEKDATVTSSVTLTVLEKSTINYLALDGGVIYENGVLKTTDTLTYNLKRNNSNLSSIEGTLVVNSVYDINIGVLVVDKTTGKELTDSEYKQYFICDVEPREPDGNSRTYNFKIDALDEMRNINKFGSFDFFLKVSYAKYKVDMTTDAKIVINSEYSATNIELTDEKDNGINNSVIDVFSSYTTGAGFEINPLILPTNVAIDNSKYFIEVNARQNALQGLNISDVFKFSSRGEVLFLREAGSESYTSQYLDNATKLTLVARDVYDAVEGVVFKFVSVSNPDVYTTLTVNFYKISEQQNLSISAEDDSELEKVTYLSSSLASTRKTEYRIKISGVSTLSGLSLVSSNDEKFEFSDISKVSSIEGESILVTFAARLKGYNFKGSTEFYFQHVTGRKSEVLTLEAFIPLSSASIQNADKSSVNVYIDKEATQSYVVEGGKLVESENVNVSASKLMVEAGAILRLNTDSHNASLRSEGVTYKFLGYDQMVEALGRLYPDLTADELVLKAEEIFDDMDGNSIATIAQMYNDFQNLNEIVSLPFSISNESLILNDTEFKGYVLALFNGYNEQHEDKTFARLFAIESFYAVQYLSSNVVTTQLYTSETLSVADIGKSYVNVTVSLRADKKTPTYTTDLSYFTFISQTLNEEFEGEGGNYLQNSYYSIGNISYTADRRALTFRLTANSTNLQPSARDSLKIVYTDKYGFTRQCEIQIVIKNANRVESVTWLNQTEDNEIYLNLTTTVSSERNFTISTSVSPNDASDNTLAHKYFARAGAEDYLKITTTSIGQTFNLNINTDKGGYGTLFLLPNDMIKIIDGVEQVIVYSYETDAQGNVAIDANGDPIVETLYFELSSLLKNYDALLAGTLQIDGKTVSNYFLNNSGKKVYYKDIILDISIVLADGGSEGTAIRIYTEADLTGHIDYSKFYRIMNNLTLTNWKTFDKFGGMFFGKDDSITLKFEGDSESFINELTGTIKDLVFSGNVKCVSGENAGFVTNSNTGTIENVVVDVYYDKSIKNYQSSLLTTDGVAYIGGLVGQNSGTVLNSFVRGLSIEGNGTDLYVGGLVGLNKGTVEGSGIEFYKFSNADGTGETYNTIQINAGRIGGFVGLADEGSVVKKSYAYAYSLLEDYAKTTDIFKITEQPNNVAAFFGKHNAGANLEESFAFLGSVSAPDVSGTTNIYMAAKNSYLTYYNATGKLQNKVFKDAQFYYSGGLYVKYSADSSLYDLTETHLPSATQLSGSAQWQAVLEQLDGNVWVLEDINEEVNFGFMYLKNVNQNSPVDLTDVQIQKNETSILKSLYVGDKKGSLFVTNVNATLSSNVEISAWKNMNTISIADLFGVSEREAASLLVTSDSHDIVIDTTSIRMLNRNVEGFTLNVHSRMDFTDYKEFKVIILNHLPELTTKISGVDLSDNQTILLQTGLNNSINILYQLDNLVYLNGQEYVANEENYTIGFNFVDVDGNVIMKDGAPIVSDDNMAISRSNNALVLLGNVAHEGSVSRINSYIEILDISKDLEDYEDYLGTIQSERSRQFNVSVYNGATMLKVEDASGLNVTPSEPAGFNVVLGSDSANDNIVMSLTYGNIEIEGSKIDDYATKFVVDSNLTLDVSWMKESLGGNQYRFKVLVKVAKESQHLIENDYENLKININALSQISNTKLVTSLTLAVRTQVINDLSIDTYAVEGRQIRNSVLYITPKDEITNTLTPSSDAIVAVVVDPAYAKMTHFTLTYEATGNGTVGTISLSRLLYDARYGYYVNSAQTSSIEKGIRVNLTTADKTGNGVYYFRLYVSSAFSINSEIKLTLTYYYKDTKLISGTRSLNIDYMPEANVKVNGESTYMVSKGSTATVTVTVQKDQNLYDLYLQNNDANITLSTWTVQETSDSKIYTASLFVGVNATLAGGKDSGIFHVVAAVERVISNVQEIKVAKATVCLVDFSVDGNGISVKGGNNTISYDGREIDALYTYVNSTAELYFDYPILPEEYSYNKNDKSESDAVSALMQKRNMFALKNSYADANVGYYINYNLNQKTGRYEELTLKEQLWYANDMSTSTAIYNNYGILQNDLFSLTEQQIDANGTQVNRLTITGKRTGRQLMRLQTIITYQGIEFVYDYYFFIIVDIWSDENTPTQIDSAEKFIDYATNSEQADDYILMNDIVLNEYTPVSTDLIKSLDGNGHTIHINSFAYGEGNNLRLALFDTINEETTLKNIRVNLYNGGQIDVNINQYTSVDIAGFALENNGVIYNCEVVAYYDSNYQSSSITGDIGLVVEYMKGNGTDPIQLTDKSGVESNVSGFVSTNNASIINSRVGGDSMKQISEVAGVKYLTDYSLGMFTITGQGNVAGFVNTNASVGNISACYADNVQINNDMGSTVSKTAGFALYNTNSIQNSYVEAHGGIKQVGSVKYYYKEESSITSIGEVAGFVYENSSLVKNCYANIAIENESSRGSLVAGFVYKNNSGAEVTLCYSACRITKTDINQMQFSGVDENAVSLNLGEITFSYFYNETKFDNTNEAKYTSGVISVSDVTSEDTFYGFSFASEEGAYDGVWCMTEEGITLVSPNEIAVSHRYAVTNNDITSIFYHDTIIDAESLQIVDISYGGENNPIIIRNATEFALATGKASTTEISAYKNYYNDSEVFGNYRIVNDLDMSEIDQNAENDSLVKLTTTKKTFSGLLDGNGFTISNINLISSEVSENFGLFAKFNNAVVMSLDLIVDSIQNAQANIVGTLAGTAVNSRILAITLTPVTTSTNSDNTYILGNNVVGGVVGMLFGESRMHDIEVQNIDIFSDYYDFTKKVGDNSRNVGPELRSLVNTGSLKDKVKNISYAGAVAGYVDVYMTQNSDFAKYDATLSVSDYDIVTVHVSDSVKIYGEVAGGLFGYVGESTYVYDASIKLNASMDLSDPSYITAKNLYSGGIVGENYGGLFAVYSSYADDIQEEIEKNEYNGYNSSTSVEKGQQSIFSYASDAEKDDERSINDPAFIGGLVGYMGGGYVYIGYSKLNVISNSEKTKAVGGLVGYAAYNKNNYELTTVNSAPKVHIYLNEVYASGDVYATSSDAYSAGIVGAKNEGAVLAFRDVMAVNYLSYANNKLSYDTTSGDSSYISEKHFMIVGGNFDDLFENQKELDSNLYLIRSDDNGYEVSDGSNIGAANIGTPTVGGYSNIVANGSVLAYLEPFGFETALGKRVLEAGGIKDTEKFTDEILQTKSMGELSSMSSAYANMSRNFLGNGWSDVFWQHDMDSLFPYIELLPDLNYIFWDQNNTADVLAAMRNSSVTVVVRGKVENEEDAYKDINLTTTEWKNFQTVTGFRGTLVSYAKFMNDSSTSLEGIITEEVRENLAVPSPRVIGGKVGDDVGIILPKPLFTNVGEGATFEGLNIYAEGNRNITLIDNAVQNVIFRELNFVYNKDITLQTKEQNIDGVSVYTAGLITTAAYATSFIDIKITLRGSDGKLTIKHEYTSDDKNVYIGLLAGYIEQNSAYIKTSVQGITVVRETVAAADKTVNIDINAPANNYANLYVGLYSGRMYKSENGKASLTVGLNPVSDVNLNIGPDAATVTSSAIYAGGFVGEIYGIDSISLINSSQAVGASVEGVSINQGYGVTELYAGLGFGSIGGGSKVKIVDDSGNSKITGTIRQTKDFANGLTQIGGIAGVLSANAEVKGFSVDLTVEKKIGEKDTLERNYDQHLYKYDGSSNNAAGGKDLGMSPYSVAGNPDDSIGGFFGYAKGSTVKITGVCNVDGVIDVSVKQKTGSSNETFVNVGGMIGKVMGSVETNVSANNNLNMLLTQKEVASGADVTAYVGGMIGKVANAGGTVDDTIKINTEGTSGHAKYAGNVVSSINNLIFGGAIGQIDRQDYFNPDRKIDLRKVAFGGAVKVYGSNTIKNLTVGGVVGNYDMSGIDDPTLEEYKNSTDTRYYTISNCLSYGDVFVNYKRKDASGNPINQQLEKFSFGGIVGSASYIDVNNSASIMTNFNSKITSSIGEYNVGAIAGRSADAVKFDENVYSSDVCLAYQEEGGNRDIAYGTTSAYSGYTTVVQLEEGIEVTDLTTSENILDKFDDLKAGAEEGEKLNPYTLGDETDDGKKQFVQAANSPLVDDAVTGVVINGSTHRIKWVAITDNLTIENVIADNLSNTVIVGNGQTVTRKKLLETNAASGDIIAYRNKDIGALVNTMGTSGSPAYNVVSGVILDLDVSVDLSNTDANKYAFGSVAGTAISNSIIYAVGVNGEASVGGNKSRYVGGLVGRMDYGYIAYSYFDGDLIYRAAVNGNVAGIANLTEGNNLVVATYSSGMIENYADCKISTFANVSNDSTQIIDSYSITSVTKSVAVTGSETTIRFIDGDYTSAGQVFHGCYEVLGHKSAADLALPYYSDIRAGQIKSILVTNIPEPDPAGGAAAVATEGYTSWYFSPFINNGYAAHGFGFLKNITAYVDVKVDEVPAAGGVAGGGAVVAAGPEIVENEYRKLSYHELLTEDDKEPDVPADFKLEQKDENGNTIGYYPILLGIPNQSKYVQMLNTVKYTPAVDPVYNGNVNYNRDYKFILLRNINMSTLDPTQIGIDIKKSEDITGTDVDESTFEFTLDGNNNTLDFTGLSMTKPLFREFEGNISNLRITNAEVTINSDTDLQISDDTGNWSGIGILAVKMTGDLNNITVTGSITNTKVKDVGGVVARLVGNATAVDAVVNISVSNINNAVTVGGVIGELVEVTDSEKHKIEYCSSSGNIDVKDSSQIGLWIDSIIDIIDIDIPAKAVGGVVGVMKDYTEISNSYNAGAVMSGYTCEENKNYIAGGVVGQAFAKNSSAEIKIDSCYNTGLVAAGNYSNETGVARAGGIVGYGRYTTVSACMNDGPVEAISNFDYENVKYEIKLDNGGNPVTGSVYANYQSDFSSNGLLQYSVTITYNKELARQIYAYGIGYLDSGEITADCASSTDNIKNDGNIGSVSTTSLITVDRDKMMNNIDGNFQTLFSTDKKLYINGYDSYGMPARVYMNFEMKRQYSANIRDLLSSAITAVKEWTTSKASGDNDWCDEKHFSSKSVTYTKSGSGWTAVTSPKDNDATGGKDFHKNGGIPWINNDLNSEIESTFYSSSQFVQYEEILRGVSCKQWDNTNKVLSEVDRIKGLVGFVEGGDASEAGDIADIDSKISEIGQEKENDKTITLMSIAGDQLTAEVYNSNNLRALVTPYIYSATATFDVPDDEKGSVNRYSVAVSGMPGGEQFKTVSLDKSVENKITVKSTYYFVTEKIISTFSPKITLNYNVEKMVTLTKDNVIDSGDDGRDIKIILNSNPSQGEEFSISEEFLENLLDKEDNGSLDSITITIDGTSTTLNYKSGSLRDETNEWYLICDIAAGSDLSKGSDLNGKTMILNYAYLAEEAEASEQQLKVQQTGGHVAYLNVDADPVVKSDNADGKTWTFTDFTTKTGHYNNSSMGLTNITETYTDAYGTHSIIVGKRVNLSTGLSSDMATKLGISGYSIYYVKSENKWYGIDGDVNDGVLLQISENVLYLYAAETISGIETKMTVSQVNTNTTWTSKATTMVERSNCTTYTKKQTDILSNEKYIPEGDVSDINYTVWSENKILRYTASTGDLDISFSLSNHYQVETKGKFETITTGGDNKLKYIGGNLSTETGANTETFGSLSFTSLQKTFNFRHNRANVHSQKTANVTIKDQSGDIYYSGNMIRLASYAIDITKLNNDGTGKILDDILTISYSEVKYFNNGTEVDLFGEITDDEYLFINISTSGADDDAKIQSTKAINMTVKDSSDLVKYNVSAAYIEVQSDYSNSCGHTGKNYTITQREETLSSDRRRLYITEKMSCGCVRYKIQTEKYETRIVEIDGESFEESEWAEESLASYNTISEIPSASVGMFNIIVADFDEKYISFDKCDLEAGQYITINVKESKLVEKIYDDEEFISMVNDNVAGEETVVGAVAGTVEIWNGREWENNGGNTIKATNCESTSYRYRYQMKKDVTCDNDDHLDFDASNNYIPEADGNDIYNESGEANNFSKVDVVLFGEDIFLNTALGNNTRTMVGKNYVLNFVSADGEALFGSENKGAVSNLNIVAQSSLRNLDDLGKNEAFVLSSNNTNSANISNVKIYGNFRNTTTAASTIYANFKTIGSTCDIKAFNNYIMLHGLDGNEETPEDVDGVKNVASVLKDIITSGEYQNEGIIISGSAIKGEDGADGISGETNALLAGLNGVNGGQAGEISITDTFKGYYRLGLAGIGGFGGNGAHGKGATKISDAQGGGGGGAPGKNGENRAPLAAGKQISGNNRIEETTKDYAYGGNGGIGGVGIIYKANVKSSSYYYKTSGSGGGAGGFESNRYISGERGSNGSGRLDFYKYNAKGYMFGYTNRINNIKVGFSHAHDKYIGFGGIAAGSEGKAFATKWCKEGEYFDAFESLLISTDTESTGPGGNGYKSDTGGGNVSVQKVYMSVKIAVDYDWKWWDSNSTINDHRKIAWTSAETINGAGGYGASKSTNVLTK